MRVSHEGRAERLADRGTTAIRADQIRSIDLARAAGVLDRHLDPIIQLPQRGDARGKIHSRMIVEYANVFATAKLFVPIIVIAIVGVVLTELVMWLERRMSRWRQLERERF